MFSCRKQQAPSAHYSVTYVLYGHARTPRCGVAIYLLTVASSLYMQWFTGSVQNVQTNHNFAINLCGRRIGTITIIFDSKIILTFATDSCLTITFPIYGQLISKVLKLNKTFLKIRQNQFDSNQHYSHFSVWFVQLFLVLSFQNTQRPKLYFWAVKTKINNRLKIANFH